jgi:hypothetical protein
LPVGQIKPLKVVIKDLPRDFPVETITEELTELEYPVTKVVQLIGFKTKKPLRLFQVTLTATEKAKSIINMEFFCHQKIRVEKYISPFKTTQCHGCQGTT